MDTLEVKAAARLIMTNIPEGVYASCPYLVRRNGKWLLSSFLYHASTGPGTISIYGIRDLILSDGEDVWVENMRHTYNTESYRVIAETPMSPHERNRRYGDYYKALQVYVDSNGYHQVVPLVRRAFLALIPDSQYQIYETHCQEFFERMNIGI